MANTKTEKTTINIPIELKVKIAKLAEMKEISFTQMIVKILNKGA